MSRDDFPGPASRGPGDRSPFPFQGLPLNPERGDHRIMVAHL